LLYDRSNGSFFLKSDSAFENASRRIFLSVMRVYPLSRLPKLRQLLHCQTPSLGPTMKFHIPQILKCLFHGHALSLTISGLHCWDCGYERAKHITDRWTQLPTPIDFYAQEVRVRIVANVDRLIDIQVSLPATVWDAIAEHVKNWPDVQSGNDRLVRRGRMNPATNIFLDRDLKPFYDFMGTR
jgi:hypothetical protein